MASTELIIHGLPGGTEHPDPRPDQQSIRLEPEVHQPQSPLLPPPAQRGGGGGGGGGDGGDRGCGANRGRADGGGLTLTVETVADASETVESLGSYAKQKYSRFSDGV